jgi:hypothetical protein
MGTVVCFNVTVQLVTEQTFCVHQILQPQVFFTPLLLWLRYSPQHTILKLPHPAFLPQCERPSFTPIHNNGQNYGSVYLSLYVFGQQTGRKKILHRIIENIPWLQSALNFFLDLLRLFPNVWILPPFQRSYYQSLYCDFVMHSVLETWPCI